MPIHYRIGILSGIMPLHHPFRKAMLAAYSRGKVEWAMLSQPLDKILFAHALTLGIAPERIEIEFVRGSERCQVVFYCPEAAAPPPADDEPQPMAQKIISIIMDLDADESLLGREIASEAGYAYSGNFRKCISALAREKKIKKFPDGGYGRFPG